MEVQKYGIMRKPNPPPFLVKTYLLVEDPSTDDVVSWNAEGSGFVVWQPAEFARDLLPTLFKHSNFSSFIRQLNTYGFRKVATSRWEFCNDLFKKGKRELLCQIRRRKAWANRPNPPASPPNEATTTMSEVDTERKSCSSSSSSEHMIIRSNLADENKRLKRENGTLTSELSYMKSKCKELHDLVALYSRSSVPAGKEEKIDEDDDKRPKLFGVRLEVMSEDEEKKRKRSSGNCHQVFDETSATTSTSTSARFNSINLSQSCKYGLH